MSSPSGRFATIESMEMEVFVVCSSCEEETSMVVEDLDAVEREVCECGYSFVVLSVAESESVHARKGRLIELPRRGDGLSRAA